MTAFDIRASDKGPGKARPPRTKQGKGGGGGSGGDGSSHSGCFLWTYAPPLMLALAFIGLLTHAP